MSTQSSLIRCKGSILTTREELRAMPESPSLGRFHRPIPHAELLDAISAGLDERGIVIRREQLAVNRAGMKLFGTLDLAADGFTNDERNMALGFRHGNDKSLGVRFVAGSTVTVCDNLMLSGSGGIILSRKHTTGFALRERVGLALDRFLDAWKRFDADVNRLKTVVIGEADAKVTLYNLYRDGVMPVRTFSEVNAAYFNAENLGFADCAPRSLWGLHNACTRALRGTPGPARFEHTQALGRAFALAG